jgi:uncharacterized RDD family membrane protein YckC
VQNNPYEEPMQSHESPELEYVGFWARVGAAIIDSILLLLIVMPLLFAVYGRAYWQSSELIMGPADVVINYILPAALVIVLWIKISATPGKKAIGAVIVDARTGEKPSTRQFIIRYIGYYVATIPLLLGIIWVGFDARKQGWHDKMAGTVVVRRKGGITQPVQFDGSKRT